MARRAAAYLRFSSKKQRDASLDDQLRDIRRYVEEHGDVLLPKHIFRDAAKSGASEAGRDGFNDMRSVVLSTPSPVDCVLFWNLERLARDIADTMLFVRELRFRRIELVSVQEGISSFDPSSRMSIPLKAMMAEWFLDDLKAKTHRGLEGQALRGWWTGGKCYGYRTRPVDAAGNPVDPTAGARVDGYQPYVYEPEAGIIRRIFALALEGKSYVEIADTLNKEKAPPPDYGRREGRTKAWAVSSIQAMLKNTRYTGTVTWNKDEFVKDPVTGKRIARARPREEWVVTHRPELTIVPVDQFDAVRAAIAARNRGATRNDQGHFTGRRSGGTYSKYLLSGLLKCGICGTPMTVHGGYRSESGKVYRSYACPARIKRGKSACSNDLNIGKDKIEGAVIGEIKKKLLGEKNIRFYVAQFKKAFDAGRADVAVRNRVSSARSELREVEKGIKNLLDYLKTHGSQAVTQELAQAEARKRELEAELAQLDTSGSPLPVPPEVAIRHGLDRLGEALAGDHAQARELLRALVGELTMTPGTMKSPAAEGEATGTGTQKDESRTPCYQVSGSVFLQAFLVPLEGPVGLSVVAGAGFEPATFGL